MTPLPLQRWLVWALAGLGMAGAGSSWGDDSSVGVPLPGLVSQPRGSVRTAKSELTLDGDAVVLRLQLELAASARTLALQGPRFAWQGGADPYPDRQFPELRIRSNGVALPPSTTFGAFAGGRDITPELAALNLDPFAITSTPPVLDPPPDANLPAFKRLLALRAVTQTEGQVWARWQAQRLWRFAAMPLVAPVASAPAPAATQAVELSYQARPGFTLLPTDALAKALPLAAYCVSAAQLSAKLADWGLGGGSVVAKSYAIAVGVDGRAPGPLTVQVVPPRSVFCGAAGQPVFGGGPAPAAARADGAGLLHVLHLDKPG